MRKDLEIPVLGNGIGNIVSLQIRIEEKWAEMFKDNAKEALAGHAEYLITLMQFAADNAELFSKWWMEKKTQQLLSGLESMGRTLEGLKQHAAYQEQQDKAKASRAKPKPPH